jgi:hypothetical protein
MDLLHHEPTLREEDGLVVCARCGLVNPQDHQPCIPPNAEVTDPDIAS